MQYSQMSVGHELLLLLECIALIYFETTIPNY